MTSEQYDGFQYGGATWDGNPASGETWYIGDFPVRVVGVTLTPTQLELDVRARTASERQALRDLDANAADVDRRDRADGTIDHLDTSLGANTFEVQPPNRFKPPRVEREFLVADISRERTSADTRATLGTVLLRPRQARAVQRSTTDADDSTKWTFQFQPKDETQGAQFDGFQYGGASLSGTQSGLEAGQIVTDRVSQVRQERGTVSLQIVLDPRHAELAETVLVAIAGATSATVPDGEDFSRDTTPRSRQTITVTPPSGASDPTPAQGEFAVFGWQSRGADGGAYRFELTMSRL
jgi:hypothetical protein